MAVPKEHIIFNYDLTDNHLIELREVHKRVKEFFGEENYFSFTRESMLDENRSVEHLHTHFLV
jgi:diadenosine tetraphosphate (Ap4A) HIT family hydrolase